VAATQLFGRRHRVEAPLIGPIASKMGSASSSVTETPPQPSKPAASRNFAKGYDSAGGSATLRCARVGRSCPFAANIANGHTIVRVRGLFVAAWHVLLPGDGPNSHGVRASRALSSGSPPRCPGDWGLGIGMPRLKLRSMRLVDVSFQVGRGEIARIGNMHLIPSTWNGPHRAAAPIDPQRNEHDDGERKETENCASE
jgi:hypothetical protein